MMNLLHSVAAFAVLAILSAVAVQASENNNFAVRGTENNGNCRDNDRNGNRGGERNKLQVFALTSDQRLICFREDKPERTETIGFVSGLTGGDTTLVGIDFRVQDGNLYGVGNAGGVYTINTTTAAATFVNRTTVALSGTSFGVDFNPAADRLRIISDTGQNLRHNVNAGGVTINDVPLSYSATGTPVATGVTGAAYTNNDLDATTATTIFDIDTNLDQVAIQSPANNGILAATGKLTVDTTTNVGFDIYSTVREGVTVDNRGYASLTMANNVVSFYTINLTTGKATSRGAFREQDRVIDIAIPLAQTNED